MHQMDVGTRRDIRGGKMVSCPFVSVDGCFYETIEDLKQAVAKLPSDSKLIWWVGFSFAAKFRLGSAWLKTAQLDQFCREQGTELVLQGGF